MKLSIITATFNSAKTLQRCLDSVACQSRIADIEHIIIDGRSTDKTLQLAAQYSHIDTIVSAQDRGIYHAFNKGITQATGDIVYFLNSDDELFDSHIADFIISQFKDSVMYLSGAVHCIEPGRSFVAREYNPKEPKSKPRHQGFICRREVFEEIGVFNECLTIAADMYLMKKVVKNYDGICTEKLIARFHLGGISSQTESLPTVIAQDKIVDYLLGNEEALDASIAEASVYSQNNLYLKKIFRLFLNNSLNLSGMRGKKIAIFGTRELSQILYKILYSYEIYTEYFLVSKESLRVYNSEIPSFSLERLPEQKPDLVVSCIEGDHVNEVVALVKKNVPKAEVISWQEIC